MAQFDIGSPSEFFREVVQPQYDEFCRDRLNVRIAVGAIIFAYHLYEWANDAKFSLPDFPRRYRGSSAGRAFELARLVANGVKHNLEKIETRNQPGDFDSGFSRDFSVAALVIVDRNGAVFSVDELLEEMMTFWRGQDRLGWPTA